MFLAIGDHLCDNAPLQVGQFEANDELLDKWLTDVYLEGHGGGNGGESYLLAWYFAAYHTAIDSLEKHGKKGFLFTIGDEPTHNTLSKNDLQNLMGPGEYQNTTAVELLSKAREKYHVFHLHIKETMSGGKESVINGWKELMQENLIIVDSYKNIPTIMSNLVVKYANAEGYTQAINEVSMTEPDMTGQTSEPAKQEEIL